MAGIQRFEDIVAWQRARELARDIYRVSNLGGFARDFGLRNQMRRAAVSIMSNIAEGFERGQREFHQFLTIAKGSCAEVRSLLHVALDAEHLTVSEFSELKGRGEEVARLVGGFRAAIADQIKSR